MTLDRLAIAFPTVLLLSVASAQMVLARSGTLSPWKGGGFGMFASVDGSPFRWARIYVSARDRSEELAITASLAEQAGRTITWPHDRAMRALAKAVIARERRHERPVDSVRIEIWRADVSPSLDVSERLVRATTVDVHEVDREHGR